MEILIDGVNMTSLCAPLAQQKFGRGPMFRRARKLKTLKFLLEAPRATPRKFAPAKISLYTILLYGDEFNTALGHACTTSSEIKYLKVTIFSGYKF